MIITSKFDGRCITCGKGISAGERVSWIKGRKGAEHAACSAEGKATATQVTASRAEVSDLAVPAPPGLSLLPYQRAGVAYMLPRPGIILADEMGLGKTIQVAGLLNVMAMTSTALIICPKSLAINWERELTKWLVSPRPIARVGQPGWQTAAITIASYEQAKNVKFRPTLEARSYDVVAVDEAHRVKNKTRAIPKAKRTVSADGKEGPKRVAVQRTQATHAMLARATQKRLLLTGTPFENRPVELFPLLQIADPATWDPAGKGFFRYAKRYCGAHQRQVNRTRVVWDFSGSSNTDELQEKLRSSCMVRRLKRDVLKELPAKRRQIVELEVSDGEVTRADKKLAGGEDYATAAARLVGSPGSFAGAAAERIRIGVAKAPASAEFINDLFEGGAGKILVGAWHHQVIDALAAELTAMGRRVVTVTGQHTADQRQRAVDAIQDDPATEILIGQIDAAGVGLNMTASATVVLAELAWTPAQVSQFEDRAHRMGQKRSVNVYHLVVQDSLEAHIAKVIIAKQDTADAVLDNAPPPAPAPVDVPEAEAKPRTERQAMMDVMAEMLSAEDRLRIHQCLRRLAGMCDGAHTEDGTGFSKIDVQLGHDLASRSELTPRQAALGFTLCRKYWKQLGADGEALLTKGPA